MCSVWLLSKFNYQCQHLFTGMLIKYSVKRTSMWNESDVACLITCHLRGKGNIPEPIRLCIQLLITLISSCTWINIASKSKTHYPKLLKGEKTSHKTKCQLYRAVNGHWDNSCSLMTWDMFEGENVLVWWV